MSASTATRSTPALEERHGPGSAATRARLLGWALIVLALVVVVGPFLDPDELEICAINA